MKNIQEVKLKNFNDDRGSLISIESNVDIDFTIQRTYFIFDTKDGVSRGFHAHRKLKQMIFCITGSCELILDNGKERILRKLNSTDEGILLEGLLWREIHNFSENCILVVLASEKFDESDYIRDYEQFITEVNKKNVHP